MIKLEKNHWNDLIKSILISGFNPPDFSRETLTVNFGYQQVVKYKPEKPNPGENIPEYYYFAIITDNYAQDIKWSSFPSAERPSFMGISAFDWQEIINKFNEWLVLLRRDIDEIDLWELYEKDWMEGYEESGRQFGIDAILSSNQNKMVFNTDEQGLFNQRFEKILELIAQQQNETNSSMQLIATSAATLVESSRNRPKGAVLSALQWFGLAVLKECGQDLAIEVKGKIKEYIIPLFV